MALNIQQTNVANVSASAREARRADNDLIFSSQEVKNICRTCINRNQPVVHRAEIRPGSHTAAARLISHAPKPLAVNQQKKNLEAAKTAQTTGPAIRVNSRSRLGTLAVIRQLTKHNPKLAKLVTRAARREKANIEAQKKLEEAATAYVS